MTAWAEAEARKSLTSSWSWCSRERRQEGGWGASCFERCNPPPKNSPVHVTSLPRPERLLGFSGRTHCPRQGWSGFILVTPGPCPGNISGHWPSDRKRDSLCLLNQGPARYWVGSWWTELSLSCGHLCGTSFLMLTSPLDSWLPPNTSSPTHISRTHYYKSEQMQLFFLLLQMTLFHPLPAGVGGWLKVTVH